MIVLTVAAIVTWSLSAVLAFGWFGVEHTPDTIANVLGLIASGLVLFALASIPWPNYFRR